MLKIRGLQRGNTLPLAKTSRRERSEAVLLEDNSTDLRRWIFGAAPRDQQQRSPDKTKNDDSGFKHAGNIQK
jgi:hypothetical protein